MRKPTSVVHIGLGMLTALVALRSPATAVLLFSGFGVYEYWSEKRGFEGGCDDFWEALFGLGVMSVAMIAFECFMTGWC